MSITGDRVQWFRAEAEMERWQEEVEIKQADFIRCINYFGKMSDVWMSLQGSITSPGKIAYAKKKSAMFKEMELSARHLFAKAGYSHLLNLTNEKPHAHYVMEERNKPEYIIPQLHMV